MKIDKNYKKLIELFLKAKTEKQMFELMEVMLTPTELEQLKVRLQILKMLKNGDTQRDISEKLGIGIATVTRGANMLKKIQI